MSRAFRLGVFIVVALLIFAAGVFWIGERHFLFSSTYRLSADFPNVAGLNGGAEVRVGAFMKEPSGRSNCQCDRMIRCT